eukprot:Transcript_28917.p1 GENE.Transcript_28917~~Transcript_28917.p1  ORF type:complete len:425 (-),score=140.88 Transcript_28917:1383-2636(-)
MAIAAAAAAAVMLLPPLPMPWWVVTLLYVTGGVLQLLWRCLRPAQPRQAAPPKVEGLFVYPVKSCQGQPQPSATLDRFGFVGDRRLMVVAATPAHGAHPALTQRQLPKMATIACAPAFDGGSLSLSAPGRERLLLPRSPAQGAEGEGAKRRLHVRVWDEVLVAEDLGSAAAEWLSAVLGTPCLLVSAEHPAWRRPLDAFYVPYALRRPWRPHTPQAAFSDGYPLQLISSASLADLNRRLQANAASRAAAQGGGWWGGSPPAPEPAPGYEAKGAQPAGPALGADRFRPNIVVSGCEPYEEDTWKRVRIGGASFRLVKGCSRCKIAATDQSTGVQGALKGADGVTPEPLATLQEYREKGAKGNVYFGQHLVHEWPPPLLWALGRRLQGRPPTPCLAVGASVEVLERGEPVWDRGPTADE